MDGGGSGVGHMVLHCPARTGYTHVELLFHSFNNIVHGRELFELDTIAGTSALAYITLNKTIRTRVLEVLHLKTRTAAPATVVGVRNRRLRVTTSQQSHNNKTSNAECTMANVCET
ncbi:unnamed protein product [Sphagnum balticum]